MKKIILLCVLFLFTLSIYSQNSSKEKAEKYLAAKGELTFSFKVNNSQEIDSFTNDLSIENYDPKTKTVFAWANEKQFRLFESKNIPFDVPESENEVDEKLIYDTNANVAKSNASKATLANTLSFPVSTYPTYAQYAQQMQDFANNYPALVQKISIGATGKNDGKELLLVKISDNVSVDEKEPKLLLTSSIHGDEIAGYPMMLSLIDYILTVYSNPLHADHARIKNLVENSEIWINPSANPDGTYYNSASNTSVTSARRGNNNGIDLNRNYPDNVAGAHPDGQAYQVETLAFMNLANTHHFVISANFHGGIEVVNYPFDNAYANVALHPDNSWFEYVSVQYATHAQNDSDPFGDTTYMTIDYDSALYPSRGVTRGAEWYRVFGGRQDYMNFYKQCKEITIELSDTKLLPTSQLANYWLYNKNALLDFLTQGTYGFRGVVKDAITGNPVDAKVTVVGHDAYGSHTFTDISHGDYYRPIKAGTYSILFEADCYQSFTLTNQTISDFQTKVLADVSLTPIASAVPTTLTAASITSNSASLGWSSASGNTFDLRYRVVGSPTWIDVLALSSSPYSLTSLTASTNYEFQVRSVCASASSAYSTSKNFSTTAITYCTSNSTNSTRGYIGNVTFGTINNTTGYGSGGYSNFTATVTDVTLGSAYNISVGKIVLGGRNTAIRVWIDYNKDGDFNDTGEQILNSGTSTTTPITSNITIPVTATTGSTRMRVSLGTTAPSNCGSFTYGEVEDYTINILPSCVQPAAPTIACYQTATFNTGTCSWDVTGTQPAQPALACYQTATFNTGTCSWDVTGTQPAQPALACYQSATFNTGTCSWDVSGTQPVQPALACYQSATFNTGTCSWDVTGTQPVQPALACYQSATFNTGTCSWDVTGTQPVQPALACYQSATFNTGTCSWDVTGTQPAQPALACYQSATFNTGTCSWDVTGTQPVQPALACYQSATFNTGTCSWDVTGTQPAAPALACYQSATFNTGTCSWDVTGTQPAAPALACYQSATFNTGTCSWDVTGTQPVQPALACYQSATFNTGTCSWDVTGTQPAQPALACYQSATFNTGTCSWDVTGTQPAQPALACYQSATFNTGTCSWDVTGIQPAAPALACYESATFNTGTCSWDVTGTQPAQPALACYQSATFNTGTCSWDVTGTQPAAPALACYESATFNTGTCSWDVTGTQPVQPALACYESATFNTGTCSWDVTGTQPAQPALACYQTATFNTGTCSWDVSGTQPAAPALACYQSATFNTGTCSWDVTGTQPAQPALACYESATFNTGTCSWDVTGTQPVQPALACYESATFNTGTCSWDVTGTQPVQPALACYQSATFNTGTCSWDVTGTQPAQPALACYESATFNTGTCSWDVTGTQPVQPALACYQSATFNTGTCSWDVTGTQPAQPALACYESATFNTVTCSWDVTGTQPVAPALACYQSATFNTGTCSWDVTGTQPAQPALACYQSATFNTGTCSWDVTGTQPVQPALACYQSATFNTGTCSWDVTGTQPAQPALACYETATFNTGTCSWDVTGTQPEQPALACYQSATFNTGTCSWDVTGTQPAQPALACYQSTTFNTGTCSWDVNGTQPAQPTIVNCWDNFMFNTGTCAWENTGTPQVFYIDADGDGYGTTVTTIQGCSVPAGYATNSADCDDSNANINPGVSEIPGNGFDDDCNPATLDASLEIDAFTIENIHITPNPFNTKISIKVPLSYNNSTFNIKVMDINGRLVFDKKYTSKNGTITVTELNHLEQAPYLVKITSTKTGNTILKRLIKY